MVQESRCAADSHVNFKIPQVTRPPAKPEVCIENRSKRS